MVYPGDVVDVNGLLQDKTRQDILQSFTITTVLYDVYCTLYWVLLQDNFYAVEAYWALIYPVI